MKINDVNLQPAKLLPKEKQNSVPPAAEKKEQAGDSLEISARVNIAESLVAAAVRSAAESDKVAAIKKQIEEGAYDLNARELAAKMLNND